MNKQALIEKALANGIQTIEIYTQKSSKESIEVYDQKVDSFPLTKPRTAIAPLWAIVKLSTF